ncbi:hypothetical protein KOR34_39990 [Posidoniimonas corsicana]|uniref:Uncharacterized protein n=1 Tax=Posidoniimonas corsicana TaxID=1938618 RepID=A0A5C5V3B4_9BACT|nr:hypothetical protein [Posidoniimonas corsicana]TWT32237.1 hypothetical protein KOR34_39990 [Posidoniimonas corsicana]
MAYWVIVRDNVNGEETLVSRAASEQAAREEAESKGLTVNDIVAIPSDIESTELAKYPQLTVSRFVAFQVFCLTVGQVASVLACIGCIPLIASMLNGAVGTPYSVEALFMAVVAGALLLCMCVSMLIVYSHVKRQIIDQTASKELCFSPVGGEHAAQD